MILEGKLELLVYSDSTASNSPQKRMIDVNESLSDSSVNQWETLRLQVANLVVDQAIAMNNIVADKLYLKSDQTVSIKVNGSATPLSGKLFYMECAVSSLSVSNSSGAIANLEIGFGA